MAFQLKTATAFAQGAWNIYILQPEWLSEKGILVSERVKVERFVEGPGIRLTVGVKSPRWVISPYVVRYESDKPAAEDDVGGPLAKLIAALPETPLRSVGFEFGFRSKAAADIQTVPRPAVGGESKLRYGVSVSIRRGAANYFLDLSVSTSADESAQLFAVCDEDSAAGVLQNYSLHFEAVRTIASEYWQVKIS